MEDEKTAPKTHINYGILTGVVLIALFVLYYVLNVFTNRMLGLIPTLIFIILVIIAQVTHAKALKGDITYGNLFAMGFKTAAAATAIYILFLIIFMWVVPSYKEQILELTRQKMVEKGLSGDQLDMAMARVGKFLTISTIAGGIIINLIIGVIASLIGAAIAPKNPRPQSTQL